MEDFSAVFRSRLSGQTEVCARKALEWLQKDLQGAQELTPSEILELATAAQLLLALRDRYGEK